MPEAVVPHSVPYTQEFTVDADYQRLLTRALYLSRFRSAAGWILLGVILIMLGVAILGGIRVFTVLWLVVIAAVWGLGYFRVRNAVRKSFPVGKVMRSGFNETHFAISDGVNSSVMAYSGFDSIEARSGVLWLRQRSPRRRFAYPGALFPDSDVRVIRAAIAGAGPHPPDARWLSSADSPRPKPDTRE
jgi:hypothetical protein